MWISNRASIKFTPNKLLEINLGRYLCDNKITWFKIMLAIFFGNIYQQFHLFYLDPDQRDESHWNVC